MKSFREFLMEDFINPQDIRTNIRTAVRAVQNKNPNIALRAINDPKISKIVIDAAAMNINMDVVNRVLDHPIADVYTTHMAARNLNDDAITAAIKHKRADYRTKRIANITRRNRRKIQT